MLHSSSSSSFAPEEGCLYKVNLGSSIAEPSNEESSSFYQVKFNFKPSSMGCNGDMQVNQGKVSISFGECKWKKAACNAYFHGSYKSSANNNNDNLIDCILIFDPSTKTFVLERLHATATVEYDRDSVTSSSPDEDAEDAVHSRAMAASQQRKTKANGNRSSTKQQQISSSTILTTSCCRPRPHHHRRHTRRNNVIRDEDEYEEKLYSSPEAQQHQCKQQQRHQQYQQQQRQDNNDEHDDNNDGSSNTNSSTPSKSIYDDDDDDEDQEVSLLSNNNNNNNNNGEEEGDEQIEIIALSSSSSSSSHSPAPATAAAANQQQQQQQLAPYFAPIPCLCPGDGGPYFEVRKSLVHEALGLSVFIRPGTRIPASEEAPVFLSPYVGERLTREQYKERYARGNNKKEYVFKVSKDRKEDNIYYDATYTYNWTRFLNQTPYTYIIDGQDEEELEICNIEFVVVDDVPYVVAVGDIIYDETDDRFNELFISYGDSYWVEEAPLRFSPIHLSTTTISNGSNNGDSSCSPVATAPRKRKVTTPTKRKKKTNKSIVNKYIL